MGFSTDPSQPGKPADAEALRRVPRELLEAALSREHLQPRSIEAVSTPGNMLHGRAAFRVDLAGGTRIKARVLENEVVARELQEARSLLGAAFTRVLGRQGQVLLEEWVDGSVLGALDAKAPLELAERAGQLLAGLHASPYPPNLAPASREWLDRARAELALLAGDGVLSRSQAAELSRALDGHEFSPAPAVLCHRDFCGANMLLDASGTLRVFDNEWFTLSPAGFDLGRTHSRWPMTERHAQRFEESYRGAALHDPGPLRPWRVAVSLWSLAIRRKRDPQRLDTPLAALRALL